MKPKKEGENNRKKASSFYSKLSEKEKELFRDASTIILPEKKILTFDDLIKFEKAKEILSSLRVKRKLTLDELFSLIRNQIFLPITIFNKKLTILESTVKYLKEEKNLSLKEISEAITRDQRNIWHIYNKSQKKHPQKSIINKTKFWIPVSIFSHTKLSSLEAIVSYLKDSLSLSYHEIALLLKRDDRTIWTVYQRARKKYDK